MVVYAIMLCVTFQGRQMCSIQPNFQFSNAALCKKFAEERNRVNEHWSGVVRQQGHSVDPARFICVRKEVPAWSPVQ